MKQRSVSLRCFYPRIQFNWILDNSAVRNANFCYHSSSNVWQPLKGSKYLNAETELAPPLMQAQRSYAGESWRLVAAVMRPKNSGFPEITKSV